MRGPKFVLVLVFGILGFNVSSAQIFITELFPTQKDSLYDYQLYQRTYWFPYSPGLYGYDWYFPVTSTLIHFPNYFNYKSKCPNYIFGCPCDYPYWQNNGSGDYTRIGSVKDNSGIWMSEIESDLTGGEYLAKRIFNSVDENTDISDESKMSNLNKTLLSNELDAQVQQPLMKQESGQNKNQVTSQINSDPRKIEPRNYINISEKVSNDFKLNSGTRKIYSVEKPEQQNVWKYFQAIYYNRTSGGNQNQNTGKSYNNSNNVQRTYYSGSGSSTQRNTSPKNNSRVSKVKNSKTR